MSASNETTATSEEPPVRSARAVFGLLGALFGIIVIIVLVALLATTSWSGGSGSKLVDGIDKDRFQAVYLTSGQAYFGKLRDGDGEWVVLRNAYYIRNASTGDASTKTPSASDSKIEIVPLAGQVGGTGDVRLNTRDIQLVQDLARTSPIVSHLKDSD